MNIAFRVDGGFQIGMGHLMRCLSLAKEFRSSGCQIFFISADPVGNNIIDTQDFEVIKIDTGIDFGVAMIQKILKAKSIDCLIIDSYQVSQEFFLKLKLFVKLLCYVDDLNLLDYPVDVLINGNIGASKMGYRPYSEQELLLLGPSFNLIREEFRGLPQRQVSSRIESILVTMGGSDPLNLTVRIMQAIKDNLSLAGIHFGIVIGRGFTSQTELYQLRQSLTNVVLYENVSRISELMLRADLAISAGGSSLYELCATGTPAWAIIVASNQEYIVRCLAELGYIKNLGWYENIQFNMLPEMIANYSFAERVAAVKGMQQLVDGYGVERVAQGILEYYQTIVTKLQG